MLYLDTLMKKGSCSVFWEIVTADEALKRDLIGSSGWISCYARGPFSSRGKAKKARKVATKEQIDQWMGWGEVSAFVSHPEDGETSYWVVAPDGDKCTLPKEWENALKNYGLEAYDPIPGSDMQRYWCIRYLNKA